MQKWLVFVLLSASLQAVELQDNGLEEAMLSFDFRNGNSSVTRGTAIENGNAVVLELTKHSPSANDRNTVLTDRGGYLNFDSPSVFRAAEIGSILTSCEPKDGYSIELWVAPGDTLEATTRNDIIFTIGEPGQGVSLFQDYDGGPVYRLQVGRANIATATGILVSRTSEQTQFPAQRIVVSLKANGDAKLYVSNPTAADATLLRASGATGFRTFGSNDNLAMGNRFNPDFSIGTNKPENNAWSGQIFNFAIFCGYRDEESITGRTGFKQSRERVQVDLGRPIDRFTQRAASIHRRISGVKLPVDHPDIQEMAERLAAGESPEIVARVATESTGFYNVTLRDFAARMSNREETINIPLNDFSATLIGLVRDNRSAKLFLTGNQIYYGDPSKAPVDANIFEDIINSNKHYEQLEALKVDLAKVLVPRPQQVARDARNLVQNSDAAGLLTTRSFIKAHHIAGTGRRPVEYAFREFLCIPIDQLADSGRGDANLSDNRIGRDIDRAPGNEPAKFETNCKACHVPMDGFRGAFAYYSWLDTRVLYSPIDSGHNEFDAAGVATKFNENGDVFPGGYITVDNSFKNYAIGKKNQARIGWQKPGDGHGVKEFGQQLADTEAFPRCMATRVYQKICKRDPVAAEDAFIEKMKNIFMNESYNLKRLFENIAVAKECIGEEQ